MKPDKPNSVLGQFDLTDRVGVVTGGAGLLGEKHAETIAELGGLPILIDLDKKKLDYVADRIKENHRNFSGQILAPSLNSERGNRHKQ